MAIANKFLHFSTRNGFLKEIANYVTFTEPNTYTVKSGKEDDWNYFKNFTVFIKDTKQIWVREQFYDCSVSLDTVMKGSQYLIDYNNENQKVGVSFDGNLTSSQASFIAAYKRVPKTGLIAGIQPMTADEAAKKIGANSGNANWIGKVNSSTPIVKGDVLIAESEFAGDSRGIKDQLWISKIDNNFWALDARHTVTAVVYDSTNTVVNTWNSTYKLFDGDYESTYSLDYGQKVVITITFDGAEGNIANTNGNKIWNGYLYGWLYVNFYYTGYPKSVTGRTYSNYSTTLGWHDLTFNACNWQPTYKNPTAYRARLSYSWLSQIEITIEAQDAQDGNMMKTTINQIDAYNERPSQFHLPLVTKFTKNKLYHELEAPRFRTTGGNTNQFVKGDGTLDSNTYLTTSGNAASATKLQTARNLWGQSFNGTADISGAITSTGLVTATGFKITNKTGFLKADGTVDTTAYLSSIPISTASAIGGIKSQIASALTSLTEITHTKLPVIVNSDGTAYSELKNTNLPNIPASLLTGTIDIERLPQGALERLVIVADETARFALTTEQVQNGDTVKQTDTEKLYFVVDDTKLNSEDGYEPYSTGTATSVPWSGITGKPSWIGITKPDYKASEIADEWVTISNAYWGQAAEQYVGYGDTVTMVVNKLEWRAEHGPKINGHRLEATYGGSWEFDSDCMNITFELDEPRQFLHFNAKPATSSSYGMIKVGSGLSISNGVLSVSGTTLTTGAQTITGIKTFKNTIIGTSQENAWATSYNYQKAALGVLQTSKDALCTALCMETAETSKRYFNISTFGNRFLISASTEKDNWDHNWADGGIFIQTNGCTTSNNGTWTFGGFTSYPDNPVWTINEKGVFSGTARNCGLITATLSNQIEAGYTYNNTSATAISTFSGFSELKPDATVISTKVIKFTGTSIIKAEYLDSMTISTNQYIIYTLSYMPNGKIAINGSIYE